MTFGCEVATCPYDRETTLQLDCGTAGILMRAAITLQSLNATYHVLSCTLNAVRALYVLEYTFYDGFESHSLV